ncbi:MAG: hypothetical protein HC880_15015 [Bacteroidia bacterium]|nr:hypothetical protein [Bacteroidia bacterium]
MDLFRVSEEGSPQVVASGDTTDYGLNYEVEESGEYLLRIQPEVLGSGFYELTVEKRPTYSFFPVLDKDNRHVISVWGDLATGVPASTKALMWPLPEEHPW